MDLMFLYHNKKWKGAVKLCTGTALKRHEMDPQITSIKNNWYEFVSLGFIKIFGGCFRMLRFSRNSHLRFSYRHFMGKLPSLLLLSCWTSSYTGPADKTRCPLSPKREKRYFWKIWGSYTSAQEVNN